MSMEKDISNYILKVEAEQLRSDVDQLKLMLEELKKADSGTFKSYMKEVNDNTDLRKRVNELENALEQLLDVFSINSNPKVNCLFYGCSCCEVDWHGVNDGVSNVVKEADRVLNNKL